MIRKTQIIYWLLLYSLTVLPSTPHYYFKQLAIEQGLSQASVNSILCDNKGVLWIGTKSGLNCFNKYELKTFFHEKENQYSLPSNYIRFIAEDTFHAIWVSTSKGLVRYDANNDRFYSILQENIYSFSNITNGILFGGDKRLYKYDFTSGKMEVIPFPDQGKANDASDYSIVKLADFEEGKVLVGTKHKGVYIYDYTTNRFQTFYSGIHNILLALYTGKDGTVYESSYGQGIFCYDHQGHLKAHYFSNNSSLKNDIVLDIIEKDGKIWLGTDGGGIYIFDPTSKKFTQLCHIPGDASSLPVNSITVLYKDQGKNLWAGSVRGGIFGIKETFIKTYKDVALNSTNGLSEKAVISIYEEDSTKVWIGTDGGGINLYNPNTNMFRHYPSTYGDKVVSITGLSETELLVSLYSKGMFSFNKKTGTYRPFTIVNEAINIQECFYGFTPAAHKVSDDKIYILSLTPWIYHPHDQSFSQVKLGKGIPPEGFLLAYSDDSISYFMRENQVFKVDQKRDSLHLTFSINPGDKINAVCYDKKHTIWVGTDQGLGYYDILRKKFTSISTKLFNNVSYLFLDNRDRLWISAQNMLFSYIISEGKFIVWSESDGFSPNEILFMFPPASRYKHVYMGGTDGFVKINKKIAYETSSHPRVELSNILFNGSSYMRKLENNSIKIPWNYTSLAIAVGLNEKDFFRKTLFCYTIVGMGRQRIESYNPELNLPSLLPGTYSIFVSCNTKNGDDTEPAKILEITITPPWYKSSWFLVICLLLVISGAVGTLQYVLRKKANRLKWKMKEYEQRVNEEKIDFLVNVNHELRTPLTLIYAPLKRLIDKTRYEFDRDFIVSQLQTIYKQAQQMKNIINMVLDLNQFNAGKESLKKQPYLLNDWIKALVGDFDNEWKEKNITVDFCMDDKIEQVWFDERKCQIILSNLLMNALKFSLPDTHISISTNLLDKMARISVSDEGIGLQNVDVNQLFKRFYQGEHNKIGSGIGLSYSKMLVEMHGGNIGAYNNPEKGATFYFELPIYNPQASVAPAKYTEEQKAEMQSSLPFYGCSACSILIVEDEKELRNFLYESFKEKFKCVYMAEDGEKAVEICHARQPDLVVSDVMMPRMDGYALCKHIKNNVEISHIPVILLTARGDSDSVRFGYKQGADFYIAKPFEIDFLFTIICNILKAREIIKRKYKSETVVIPPQEATISKGDEDFLIKFNELVNQNLSNPDLTIKFLTCTMAMSRASLYNKVSALTGLGVNDYINRLRIDKATYLLKNTNLNINEISYEVGFTYPRYFSTVFKQLKGVTPTQYKEKENLNNHSLDG